MDAKDMIKELAERIQKTANVRAVFGEAIHEGGTTIVPVSRVMVRGGGGGGSGDMGPMANEDAGAHKGQGTGMGLGLNLVTSPVGYIKMAPEGPEFVSIVDRNRVAMMGLGVFALALLVGKTAIKYSAKRAKYAS